MTQLKFRTITVVEGPEIDEWMKRQDDLERADAAAELDAVSKRTAYLLLGGTLPSDGVDHQRQEQL